MPEVLAAHLVVAASSMSGKYDGSAAAASDSGTEAGSSWRVSQAAALPAAVSCAKVAGVKPQPSRLR